MRAIDPGFVPHGVLTAEVSLSLHPGGQVRRLVRAEAGAAQRAQEVAQGAVAEEVDPLLRQVELHLLRRALRLVDLPLRVRQLHLAAGHAGRMGA